MDEQMNIVDELRNEADLCRNETAEDVAYLLDRAADEVERLQRILDSRPAINAGLPETYIQWSQGVTQTDIAQNWRAFNSFIGH